MEESKRRRLNEHDESEPPFDVDVVNDEKDDGPEHDAEPNDEKNDGDENNDVEQADDDAEGTLAWKVTAKSMAKGSGQGEEEQWEVGKWAKGQWAVGSGQ